MTDESPTLDPRATPAEASGVPAPPSDLGWVASAFWTYAAIVVVAALAIALGWASIEDALDARRLFR